MASLLQQLENNEAVLLMYIANELPADDRAEVEQMLSVDANLRAELARLREAHETFESAMAVADSAGRPAVPQGAAVRRVSRAIRQWQAQRVKPEPVAPIVRTGLRYPWWTYPLATAAAVMLAYLAWWGNHSDSLDTGPRFGPEDNAPVISENDKPATEDPSDANVDVPRVQLVLGPLPGLDEASDSGLQDAERQLRALSDANDLRGGRINQ